MDHGRDAEDARLLDSREHARLLATYEPVIVARCVAALPGGLDAEDLAQDVKLRLWRELQAGKTYPVPYRVVVHKVIDWTLKDHWAGRDTTAPLPEGFEPAAEDDAEGRLYVQSTLTDTSSPPIFLRCMCRKWLISWTDGVTARPVF